MILAHLDIGTNAWIPGTVPFGHQYCPRVYSPTLFVRPTSLPHMSAATATLAAKSETDRTGPSTVGMMEEWKTRMSGSHEILESWAGRGQTGLSS
jgi:hypothetical protein